MSKPWKDKRHVVSDLDQLCDMYEPKGRGVSAPNIKLLTMERNPSPLPVPVDDAYLTHGFDLADDDSLPTEPDFESITAMIRSVAPSYSNDYIEEAYGYQGRLLDQSRKDVPYQTAGNSKQRSAGNSKQHSVGNLKQHSTGNSTRGHVRIGMGNDSDRTQLNPYSEKFVPLSQISNVPSGDSAELIYTETPEKELSATKLDPDTPEFKPFSHNQYLLLPPGKSKPKSEPCRHPASKLSSLNVITKMKRNCAMENMFQRYVKGECADTVANIEFNPALISNFNPPITDGNSKIALENFETFDDSIETTEDSVAAAKELTDARLVFGFVESRSAPPSAPLTGPSNGYRKRSIGTESKIKVLSWLSSDCKTTKTGATRNINIPFPPKPKVFEPDDEAFTFIKKTPRVAENVHTANILDAREESIPDERMVDSESRGASAAQALSAQDKKVMEIYNKLKAKQELKTSNNASNTTSTYESFIEKNRSSSNTIWDYALKSFENKSRKVSKDPKK